jgi:hypothetical protein
MCCLRLSPPHLHLEFPLFSPALLQISIHVPRSIWMRQVRSSMHSMRLGVGEGASARVDA